MYKYVKLKDFDNYYYIVPENIEISKNDYIVIKKNNDSFIKKVEKIMYFDKLNILENEIERILVYDELTKYKKSLNGNKSLFDKLKVKISNLINVTHIEYNFSKTKLYIYFTSDDRVDFRKLIQVITKNLKQQVKIELIQIGIRDKAKYVGGIGPCGRFICCSSFLTEFNSVSINMAKNQFISLTPNKINGLCGRLLCCLKYENDFYLEKKNRKGDNK